MGRAAAAWTGRAWKVSYDPYISQGGPTRTTDPQAAEFQIMGSGLLSLVRGHDL